MRRFKRICAGLGWTLIAAAAALALVELGYRGQWLDTYRPELLSYNPAGTLRAGTHPHTVLVLGDSFSAGTNTCPALLRARLPGARVVNAAVSGTGIRQTMLIAPRRLAVFRPRICVYQLFAGNDLFDIRYPRDRTRVSWGRYLYWRTAEHWRSLAFLNYRLAQMAEAYRQRRTPRYHCRPRIKRGSFSSRLYDPREKRDLQAEPRLLENQILVTDARRADFAVLLAGLRSLHALCRRHDCRLVLLVLPHACQVHPVYLGRIRALGAEFSAPDRMQEAEYPFLAGIRQIFVDTPDVCVLNPLPLLQEEERRGRIMYFQNHGHLSPAGQQVVAGLLAEAIAGSRAGAPAPDAARTPR